mgnify:CR=1 FL=1|jgi:hypothetical protein
MNLNKLITSTLLMVLASVSYGQDANNAESIVDGLAEMHEQGVLNDEEFNSAKIKCKRKKNDGTSRKKL